MTLCVGTLGLYEAGFLAKINKGRRTPLHKKPTSTAPVFGMAVKCASSPYNMVLGTPSRVHHAQYTAGGTAYHGPRSGHMAVSCTGQVPPIGIWHPVPSS